MLILCMNTGYEWWLMVEAKKRNPDIKIYALSWVRSIIVDVNIYEVMINTLYRQHQAGLGTCSQMTVCCTISTG